MIPSPLYVHAGHVDLTSEEFLRDGMSDSLGGTGWLRDETSVQRIDSRQNGRDAVDSFDEWHPALLAKLRREQGIVLLNSSIHI